MILAQSVSQRSVDHVGMLTNSPQAVPPLLGSVEDVDSVDNVALSEVCSSNRSVRRMILCGDRLAGVREFNCEAGRVTRMFP